MKLIATVLLLMLDTTILLMVIALLPPAVTKVESGEINACVHKHEGADDIVRAWRRLSAGESYISPKFFAPGQ